MSALRDVAWRLRRHPAKQHPQWLAENAARATALGSYGVDLNCGCPSKVVNGSGGGATLLKDPELIYQGAKAMRAAVPSHLPVTVKVRLGWDSGDRKFEIADAVQQAGASELVVHGRTKAQGYRAEHIDWQAIGEIRQRLTIPVIANGEIWDWQSAQACMATSGCDAVMIGRGALNIPNLSRVVKYNEPRMPWPEVVTLLQKYTRLEKQGDTGLYHVARIKQWLGYLRKEYIEATELFQSIRALNRSSEIARAIQAIKTNLYSVQNVCRADTIAARRRNQKIILNTPVTTNSPIRKIIKIAHRRIFIVCPFIGKYKQSIGKY